MRRIHSFRISRKNAANCGRFPANEVNFAERPLAGIYAKLTKLRDNSVVAMVRFSDAQSDYFSVFTAQIFRLGVWGNRPILADLRENGWEEPQSNIAPFISLKNCASSGFYPRTLFANFRELK